MSCTDTKIPSRLGFEVETNQVFELDKACVAWRRMLVFD